MKESRASVAFVRSSGGVLLAMPEGQELWPTTAVRSLGCFSQLLPITMDGGVPGREIHTATVSNRRSSRGCLDDDASALSMVNRPLREVMPDAGSPLLSRIDPDDALP